MRSEAAATGSARDLSGIPWRALIAIALWGVSFPATRIALTALPPEVLVAVRTLLGAGVLVSLAFAGGAADRRAAFGGALSDRRVWALALLLAPHLLIQAHGLRFTSAVHTGWIVGFMPITIAAGATIFGLQRLSGMGWIGCGVGLAGVTLVTLDDIAGFAHAGFGDALQLISCLTWTGYTLIGTRVASERGAIVVTACAAMLASVLLVPFAAMRLGHVGAVTLEAAASAVFLGALCSGAAYALWYASLKTHGPVRSGATLYLEPLVTMAAAAMMLGEPISAKVLVGGAVIVVGMRLVGRGN